MSRTATLLQIRTDIAAAADLGTPSATGRYTPTFLNRRINQSIQRFREKLSSEGVQHYLTHATGTLTTGATSPHSFGLLDLSAVSPSVVRVYGLDIKLNGLTQKVDQVDLNDARDKYGGPLTTGFPTGWANYGTAKLALFPPPDSAYTYVAYYLPVLADLSGDSDTFDGVSGWEDWIVWDVALQCLGRDNYATQFQLLSSLKQEVWADVLRNATRVTSAGGAAVGRDSLGRSLSRGGRKPVLPPP